MLKKKSHLSVPIQMWKQEKMAVLIHNKVKKKNLKKKIANSLFGFIFDFVFACISCVVGNTKQQKRVSTTILRGFR